VSFICSAFRSISLASILFLVTSSGLAQEDSKWPIVFPKKLLAKSPVYFPLNQFNLSPDIPGDFVRFAGFVKTRCTLRYGVDYGSRSPKDKTAYVALANINKLNKSDSLKITCALPVLVNSLNNAGSALRGFSTRSKVNVDLPSVLAAGALDIDLMALGKAPDKAVEFFSVLRFISRSWPYILAETGKWDRDNDMIDPGSLRQIQPWLTSFSSYSALSDFQGGLPCVGDFSINLTTQCDKVKAQVSKILQVALTRINGTPKVRVLITLEQSTVKAAIPGLTELKVMDSLVRGILETDNIDLPWSDSGPVISPSKTWQSIIISFEYFNRGQFNFKQKDITPITFKREIIPQLRQTITSLGGIAPLVSVDLQALSAVKLGFQVIYQNVDVATDEDFLRRYMSLKRFLDLQRTAKMFDMDKCVQCLEPLNNFETATVEKLVREIAQMARDIFSLADVNQNDSDSKAVLENIKGVKK
jgi:hypothetical protein